MPARWRTKSGCLTCRMRRKKCDEDGPSCRACRRNRLTCVWQTTKAPVDGKGGTLSKPNHVDQGSSPISRHLSPFENPSRETLYRHLAATVLPKLFFPGIPLVTAEEVFSFGARYPCLRDTFLACAALFMADTSQPVPADAVVYYGDAVRSTRKMIAESRVKGTEDWLLAQTLLMSIFERAQPGTSCRAISHLQGASRIMTLKMRAIAFPQPPGITPFQQTCAATLLYHAATTALLSPDITWLPERSSLEQVQHFIEPSYSPLFATPPSLCRHILEISRLARRTPLSAHDQLITSHIREQLDPYLPLQSDTEVVGGEQKSVVEEVDKIKGGTELYALAADILLLKVTEPQITAEDSRVQGRVKQILDILKTDIEGMFWNQHYSWPILVIGCAVQRETEMLFLLGRLQKLWESSAWGDVKRILDLMKSMLRSRRQNAQFASMRDKPSPGSPDPFDLLLHPDGLSHFYGVMSGASYRLATVDIVEEAPEPSSLLN